MKKIRIYYVTMKSYLRNAGFSPRHDWRTVLGIFAVLIVVIFIASGTMFVRFSMSDRGDVVNADTPVGTIDREKLSQIIERFEKRSLEATPTKRVLVDPSR